MVYITDGSDVTLTTNGIEINSNASINLIISDLLPADVTELEGWCEINFPETYGITGTAILCHSGDHFYEDYTYSISLISD